jgi:hypothetical protein
MMTDSKKLLAVWNLSGQTSEGNRSPHTCRQRYKRAILPAHQSTMYLYAFSIYCAYGFVGRINSPLLTQ